MRCFAEAAETTTETAVRADGPATGGADMAPGKVGTAPTEGKEAGNSLVKGTVWERLGFMSGLGLHITCAMYKNAQ